ncbi:uncharacterized protein L969DRAFT_96725 [Mixia osmundae IAM 14324]|uniref:Helicase ATP-binding domain-containing protein n=1 Tax=Mixia osmundae (strain CBS 9802 / IAM 14324 / JCM 22182 / KY 12970) TaxID=764103 RepID=G7DZI2_MIXOS|nr:uncharacterized protein L969DRAFT_96725 [Mixia osmundae IAM 14324]KEI37162.1 hypothetical protein L969DRAFT_96725 [Mixia osmundae IAM 14324]GAA95992.1 hypothetical protein E5Q_02650 [Mixia osmundae IAM 14324]
MAKRKSSRVTTPRSSRMSSIAAASTTDASESPMSVEGADANSTRPTSPAPGADESPIKSEAGSDATYKPGQKTAEPKAEPERMNRLNYLLNQSGVYTEILAKKMDRQRDERRKAAEKAQKADTKQSTRQGRASNAADPADSAGIKSTRSGAVHASTSTDTADSAPKPSKKAPAKVNKRKRNEEEDEEAIAALDLSARSTKAKAGGKAAKTETGQPSLVTGATLRDYQVAGVEWLVTLYENGLNGILADEMGLGKTLQTISFMAYLREKGVWGPFLIVCPLSTLANWVNEFERFTPSIPVVLYHGTPAERASLRSSRMSLSTSKDKSPATHFPVVVTSYELVMNDRKYLSKFQWKYIVVDEGHRLKNLNCKLIQELKTYTSANRLLLTGTPLQNNLAEMWSLLNFLLPSIFDDLDSFQEWFNFEEMSEEQIISSEASNSIVSKLHAILKPFLLRRLKIDVEKDLPPKKEYLLTAPLTRKQKELYDAVISRNLRSFLLEQKTRGDEPQTPTEASTEPATPSSPSRQSPEAAATIDISSDEDGPTSIAGRTRKRARFDYAEKADTAYFEDLENGVDSMHKQQEQSMADMGRAHNLQTATKSINNMKLQNLIMQLRKVCNHPWLFDWPVDPRTGGLSVNEDLINASGKMLLLNTLLDELFSRNHKVLLFSQFTSMLDIIEDWAAEYKGWKVCRIDGSTKQDDRRQQMKDFNEGTGPDSPKLFLLSTRAGGVGITLTGADTVVLFDSDWNPTMDDQASARAHRIGQTKPVLIFRLVSGHTVEENMLVKASSKRRLEQLVIGAGKFKIPGSEVSDVLAGKGPKKSIMAELSEVLLAEQSEQVALAERGDVIISKAELDSLLDRSDAAMTRAKGWKSKAQAATVFEAAPDETNDALAKAMAVKD